MEKLTFKQFILFEAREDFIADRMGDKIMLAYKTDNKPGTPKNLPDALSVVKYISTHTIPAYINWTTNQYIKRQFSLEDVGIIKRDLTTFNTLKPILPNKDINTYPSWNKLREVVEAHQDKIGKKEHSLNYENKIKEWVDKGEAAIVYNKDGIIIVHTKTHAANCALGSGTKWCTTAYTPRTFDSYNKQGPIYIIYLPNKRKYQLHEKTRQFMDEQDSPVLALYSRNIPLFVEYPQLLKILDTVLKDGKWLIDKVQTIQKLPQIKDRINQGNETHNDLVRLVGVLFDVYDDDSDFDPYDTLIYSLRKMGISDPRQALLKVAKVAIKDGIDKFVFHYIVYNYYQLSDYTDIQSEIDSFMLGN